MRWRWRWPVTLAAGLAALPYLAWVTDPTGHRLSAWLEARLGFSGAVSAVALGGLLAVLMIPLHRRLGPLIDRRMERRHKAAA